MQVRISNVKWHKTEYTGNKNWVYLAEYTLQYPVILSPMIERYCPLKVTCNVVQALRLCTGCTAHRESGGIALLFLEHGSRRGWGISFTPRPLFTSGKDPVPFAQEAGWAPGRVWTGAENLAPTGIRSPYRPARSQSLYRLSYPAHYCPLTRRIFLVFVKTVSYTRYTLTCIRFTYLIIYLLTYLLHVAGSFLRI